MLYATYSEAWELERFQTSEVSLFQSNISQSIVTSLISLALSSKHYFINKTKWHGKKRMIL